MEKHQKGMPRNKQRKLKAKYNDGTLTKSERDEWWPFRLKQMRDEYYKKRGGVRKSGKTKTLDLQR